jgi:Leucine-rich repeat (LRR) protein
VGLRGQLPFSDNVWSALPELQTVNLGNNFVGGYLPPNIGTLNNLESLNLSGNQFNGMEPLTLSIPCMVAA